MSLIPKDYKPHFRKSAFTDPWEPLYSRIKDAKLASEPSYAKPIVIRVKSSMAASLAR